MGLIYIETDPLGCARSLVDEHLRAQAVTMIHALINAHLVLDRSRHALSDDFVGRHLPEDYDDGPLDWWIKLSSRHYQFAYFHMVGLGVEYRKRFDVAQRDVFTAYKELRKLPFRMPIGTFSSPPADMPDEFRHPSRIKGFRRWYVSECEHEQIVEWTGRKQPDWWASIR